MIVTNKRTASPELFKFDDIEIKCVNEFNLLGVTIDDKLSFNTHVSNIGIFFDKKDIFLIEICKNTIF